MPLGKEALYCCKVDDFCAICLNLENSSICRYVSKGLRGRAPLVISTACDDGHEE